MNMTRSPQQAHQARSKYLVQAVGCVALVSALAWALYGCSPEPVDPAKEHAKILADCRESFEWFARELQGYAYNESSGQEQCAGYATEWAKALPDSKFTTSGSALVMDGSAYSLSGAYAQRNSLWYGHTEMPTVVVMLPKSVEVTLRFHKAADADAAMAAIAEAMGRSRS